MRTNKQKITIPPEVEQELKEQEDAFHALREESRKKINQGWRPENLSDLHLYDGFELKKSQKTGREQIVCKKCNEIFVADINGDHLLFEDQNHKLIMVKFKEFIAVCNKCFEGTRFSIDGEPDIMQDINGKTRFGKLDIIKGEMELNNIKKPEAKITFLKKKLLNL